MNSTEVASSPKSSDGDQTSQLVRIQVFVFLAFLLSLLLFPLAIVRRRYNSSVLKAIAMGINAAIIALIPYVLGLMQNLGLKDEIVSFWAVFLFYLYFNVPNVLKFNDPLSIVMANAKISLYMYYIGSVRPELPSYSVAQIGIFSIFMASMFKIAGSVFVLRSVVTGDIYRSEALDMRMSNSDGHGVGDALADLRRRPLSGCNDDPWLRCNYIVYHAKGNFKPDSNDDRAGAGCYNTFLFRVNRQREITVHEIWSYEEEPGCILSSSSSSDDLKSYCLSFSLFQKLHSKFAGGIPYQSSDREEAWNLVRNGLLLVDSGNRCPFRVIEAELAFLYDYLYNSTCYMLYVLGFSRILIMYSFSLVGIGLVLAATLEKNRAKEETVRIRYHEHDVDVLLTWIVIIAATLLEFMQLTIFLSSRWSKMMLLRLYLSRESWKRENAYDGCINKAAQIILGSTRGGGGGGELFKPWQRQLGQYSLLDSYSYVQSGWMKSMSVALYLETGIRFLRPGRKQQSKSAPLTNEIKKAVIQTLLDRGHQLTNGIATLQASDELPLETKRKLAWACTHVNNAQVVLIWHVATSLCEIKWKQIPPEVRDDCNDDVNVATTLSKYCAYLVAFAPNMLPGHVVTTDYTCSMAIGNAYSCLKTCEASNVYDELMNITVKDGVDIEFDDPNSQRDAASVLQQGAVLGKVLVTKIEESRERWKVLAGFWAEMILYLAPNANNEWAHAESLVDGGEFITHLWALLFHAGIVDRDSFSNRARDEEADPPRELQEV